MLLPLACWLGLTSALPGQQLQGELRLNGSAVLEAFEPIREVLQESSAVILEGWRSIGFGVVVSPDGYVLTKASELEEREELALRIGTTQYKDLEVVATDIDWDVALLKVDADGLTPVRWAEDGEPRIGSWVVSNGATSRSRRRARVGIISANAREIGGESNVVLGVVIQTEDDRVVVAEVRDDGGAKKAGLAQGDILLSADGTEIKERDDLMRALEKKAPGDKLELEVERDGKTMSFAVELMPRHRIFDEPRSRNDAMSGRYSARRSNFPRVLQHDIGLSERSVGGPLLNLDGHCVGMNIARANRSESLAIPAAELRAVLTKLLEGSR